MEIITLSRPLLSSSSLSVSDRGVQETCYLWYAADFVNSMNQKIATGAEDDCWLSVTFLNGGCILVPWWTWHCRRKCTVSLTISVLFFFKIWFFPPLFFIDICINPSALVSVTSIGSCCQAELWKICIVINELNFESYFGYLVGFICWVKIILIFVTIKLIYCNFPTQRAVFSP